ncbi:MAG: ribosome recycling factor [Actinobacteria bacterium]|nr:ribosome recycling factor [Actinomycetota bacterium]
MSSELIEVVTTDATDRMAKAVAHTRSEFAGVRTGRATPALIEKLPVEYYGSEVPLQQLASFSVPEARQLLVTPFDKGSMAAVERAIQMSDLGLNPSNDGVTIRLVFPPLTAERRAELVKVVKSLAEDGRVSVRNARRAARRDLEELADTSDVSDDDLARANKDLDKITHSYESQISQALAQKERELLED